MGTRACIIIRFGGRFYTFFRRYDGYPSGAGQELIDEIITLICRFGGDVMAMCEMLKAKLINMRCIATFDWQDDPAALESKISPDALEWDESMSTLLAFILGVPEDRTVILYDNAQHYACWCLDYAWTLDLDDATLTMDFCNKEGVLTVPMRYFYRFKDVDEWSAAFDESRCMNCPYRLGDRIQRHLAAARIQHLWRGWKVKQEALEKALEPDTGYLFRLGRRHFEAAAGYVFEKKNNKSGSKRN